MIEAAKLKIKNEINKSNDPYIKTIGKYLLNNIEINKETAKKINNGEKTLKKSLEEVKKIAKGKAINGCAVMEDEEVYKIVKDYFGLVAVQDKIIQVEAEEIKEKHNINQGKVIDVNFNVRLEDFM